MSRVSQALCVVCALGLAGLLCAQEPARTESSKDAPRKAPAENPAFEKLKSLAGAWVMVSSTEGALPPDAAEKPALVYRVIAAGTVVHEHMFPETDHEMVTVYHMDGPDLVVTHYCCAGNQPRMKAEPGADAKKIVFKFAGGTNLDPAKDVHMRDLTVTFVDADTLQQEWSYFEPGKPLSTTKFELKRKK
jgi:hypothetical protein